jgi:hypothetical protein
MLKRSQQLLTQSSHDLGDGWKADIAEAGQSLEVRRTRIYDQIDGSFMDVEPYNERHYWSKYVAYCTACRHPAMADDIGQRRIKMHIKTALGSAHDHVQAEAMDMVGVDGAGKRCSSCGVAFLARPMDVHSHIERAKASGPKHRDAEVRVMKRFSLEPPVLADPEPTPMEEGMPAPQAEEGRRKSRRRRRHRGHHKGSAA